MELTPLACIVSRALRSASTTRRRRPSSQSFGHSRSKSPPGPSVGDPRSAGGFLLHPLAAPLGLSGRLLVLLFAVDLVVFEAVAFHLPSFLSSLPVLPDAITVASLSRLLPRFGM